MRIAISRGTRWCPMNKLSSSIVCRNCTAEGSPSAQARAGLEPWVRDTHAGVGEPTPHRNPSSKDAGRTRGHVAKVGEDLGPQNCANKGEEEHDDRLGPAARAGVKVGTPCAGDYHHRPCECCEIRNPGLYLVWAKLSSWIIKTLVFATWHDGRRCWRCTTDCGVAIRICVTS